MWNVCIGRFGVSLGYKVVECLCMKIEDVELATVITLYCRVNYTDDCICFCVCIPLAS